MFLSPIARRRPSSSKERGALPLTATRLRGNEGDEGLCARGGGKINYTLSANHRLSGASTDEARRTQSERMATAGAGAALIAVSSL